MTKQEKNEVIEVLKGKFTQYNNFYVTDTESLTVAQVTKLRSHCFDKQVEMKVAKNTLIKKALESLDTEKYAGVYDSLHNVTALLFSENPKEPALILSGFRKESKGEKPELKAAFINGDIFVGDSQLKALTQIKTKNELIGEVIGLLQSPIQRVLGALLNKDAANAEEITSVVDEVAPAAASVQETPESANQNAPTAEAAKPTEETVAPAAIAVKAVEAEAIAPQTEAGKPTQEASSSKAAVVVPADEDAQVAPEASKQAEVPATEAPKASTEEEAAPEAGNTKAE